MRNTIATAYEESGHAVMGHIQGLKVLSATIREGERTFGQVTFDPEKSDEMLQRKPFGRRLITAAGQITRGWVEPLETLGEEWPDDWESDGGKLINHAADWVRASGLDPDSPEGKKELSRWVTKLLNIAAGYMDLYHHVVTEVATHLLNSETLTCEEMEAIFPVRAIATGSANSSL